MNHDEKKVVADQLFNLAYQAETEMISKEAVIAQLWAIANSLRTEIREDAQK